MHTDDETSDRLTVTRTSDGCLRIRSEANPDAWIKSSVVVSLDRDRAVDVDPRR
jgi:hypothetical protein